jgi:hypothetical protein
MDPQNPRAPFHLPLLHTLVEEGRGEEVPFRFRFMGRKKLFLRWARTTMH